MIYVKCQEKKTGLIFQTGFFMDVILSGGGEEKTMNFAVDLGDDLAQIL